MPKSQRKKPKPVGRPNILGDDAAYLTVKFTREQIRQINRLAGPAPGTRPETIRNLLDEGLRVVRSRATRC